MSWSRSRDTCGRVKFVNHLSQEDMLRSTRIPETAGLLAGAWLCLIEGCDLFATETVNPIIQLWIGMDQRETAFAGLYYRILGFCRTVMLLKAIVHQQSITSAERSVLELYVDMELLDRGAVEHVVDKIITHIDVQKLKAARRVVQFYADNTDLDAQPLYSLPHRDFIAKWADLTMQKAEILWLGKGGRTIIRAAKRSQTRRGCRTVTSPLDPCAGNDVVFGDRRTTRPFTSWRAVSNHGHDSRHSRPRRGHLSFPAGILTASTQAKLRRQPAPAMLRDTARCSSLCVPRSDVGDCDRTVIRQRRNLEEHRGLRTYIA